MSSTFGSSDGVVATIPIPTGVDPDAFILSISKANEGIRVEQTSPTQLTLMPPAGFETSDRDSEICLQLRTWSKKSRKGRVTDSNTLFTLPDGRKLGPNAAWISSERLKTLSRKQREGFLPVIPEFVMELRSPSHSLAQLRRKMARWIDGGVEVAWLVDPVARKVEIYRRGDEPKKTISDSLSISGDGPVEGFILQLEEVWALDRD